MAYRIGDLISFGYPAVHQQGTRAHDKNPLVLVLHPNWGGVMHGLNFNYLTPDEINTVRMILDPMFEMQYREALQKRNPKAYAELDNILSGKVEGAEGPNSRVAKITSPRAFYMNIIRPFIIARNYDPYRLYRPEKMSNVRIVQTSQHMTGVDSMAKFKAQRANQAAKLPNNMRTQQNQTQAQQQSQQGRGVMQWFRDKFQNMRGPRTPGFKPSGPGALPGTRDDE